MDETTRLDDSLSGDVPVSSKLSPRPGLLIGRCYRLQRPLGAGAMGEVWAARHEELRTEVALKLALHTSGATRHRTIERFRFEAQVAAQLAQRSRHVVGVFDAGRHEEVPFMVMELIKGHSLAELLEEQTTLPLVRIAEILEQLSNALSCAHEHAIWHRDIKPANIMIDRQADPWLCKLADFGVAKALGDELDVDRPRSTTGGVLVGTPAYMSPEQIVGKKPSAVGDLWSLGIVAYECLTGCLPFEGNTAGQLLINICQSAPIPPSAHVRVPAAIDAWFARAFAPSPEQRFKTAAVLASAFREAISSSCEDLMLQSPAVQKQASSNRQSSTKSPVSGYTATEMAIPPPSNHLPADMSHARWLLAGAGVIAAVVALLWRIWLPGTSQELNMTLGHVAALLRLQTTSQPHAASSVQVILPTTSSTAILLTDSAPSHQPIIPRSPSYKAPQSRPLLSASPPTPRLIPSYDPSDTL